MHSVPTLGPGGMLHWPGNYIKDSSVKLFFVASETTTRENPEEDFCYEFVY